MQATEKKEYYFYLWRHKFVDADTDKIIERTCFGITSNYNNRRHNYEGHVGHSVKFNGLWKGPERLIRTLESQVKDHSHGFRFKGHNNATYEWITEEVTFEQMYDWVNYTLVPEMIGIEEITDPALTKEKS